MTPKEYFEKQIPQNLETRRESLSQINAIYQFDISGDQGGCWTLDLTVPGGTIQSGISDKATCTIKISDENFLKMISGQLNPQMAFMTGKLKVQGNMGQALKLQKIF
ncbi:MAG: SCP2 sterol-binding domain-containing protein [Deltaproteobacteria bacterium]|nr:SCP2 sterol-binding domain-containing protein [Deltaproteobacteria bacterium]MBI2500256.1 SCP2 sterol-binding domain-containing protein [Deltaproteobacteria bacterium]MBI4196598.1 SCP2 sterol-binding domain-containing protein [Deltaproteobacteria bacterium]